MLLGPIFQVEMVSTARRGRYFLLRLVYGLLILLVLWGSYAGVSSYSQGTSIQASARMASTFFAAFCSLQLMAILLVGPAMAVGTIATERERRTIEYLFVSDLSNAEIVLGKLTARLLLLGKLILVGLPVLFIFRLLGGIPARLLLASFLVAGSSAVLVTSVSLCVSVWSPRSRDATVRVYLLLFVMLVVPSICIGLGTAGGFFRSAFWQSLVMPVAGFLASLNPLVMFGAVMGSSAMGVALDMQAVFEMAGRQLLTSLGFVLLAIAAVRRVHLRSATRGETSRRRDWSLSRLRWKRPLGRRPMIWKELFAATAASRLGLIGTVCLAIILATILGFTIWFFLMAVGETGWQRDSFLEYLATQNTMLGTGVLLLLAGRAAGGVTHEKERDCWTSLLATPLSGREIMWAKWLGNFYWLRWPLLLMMLTWFLGVLLEPEYLLASIFTAGTFLISAGFVITVGLNYSLRSKTTLRAMGATLATVFFIGGGYLFCCCPVMMGSSGGDEMFVILAGCIPFLLVYPSIAVFEHGEAELALLAYIVGNFGYLIVTFVLSMTMTEDFDRINGRVHLGGGEYFRPPEKAKGALALRSGKIE